MCNTRDQPYSEAVVRVKGESCVASALGSPSHMGGLRVLLAGEAPGAGWPFPDGESAPGRTWLCFRHHVHAGPAPRLSPAQPAHRSRRQHLARASWGGRPCASVRGCCGSTPALEAGDQGAHRGDPFWGSERELSQVPLQRLVTAGNPWCPWVCRRVTPTSASDATGQPSSLISRGVFLSQGPAWL